MTRAEVFLGGRWAVEFALSLVAISPSGLSPELLKALSIFATLVFWIWAWKVIAAIVRRVTGFDRAGPRR